MRLLSFLFFALFAFSASASHMLGGGISWEKTASGQFVFELTLYRECGAGSASLSANQNIDGPNGVISVSRTSVVDITPVCTGSGAINCSTSPAGVGGVEMNVYKSAPITLQGTPPVNGWVFSHTQAARSATVNVPSGGMFYFESTMYPGFSSSSPKFVETPNHILTSYNNNFSVKATSDSKGDSLYYTFTPPKTAANTPVTYSSGFSFSSPFPSSATNSANGSTVIDGNTGLVTYDVQVATPGLYTYAIAVEQWVDGILTAKISREFLVGYNSGSFSNTAPTAVIDTAQYSDIIQTGPSTYKTYKYIGDSVSFVLLSSDGDMNPTTFLPQNIAFYAKGSALAMPWGATGGMYNVTPTINPVAPQTGFVNAGVNSVSFLWTIDNEHFNPYNNSHFFTFTFTDDNCAVPGENSITLQVVVRKAVSITADTLYVCAGDSIQLAGITNDGMYSWTPTVGLSDATISSPMASPSASGYYYLSNGNGDKDSVYVDVHQAGTIDLAFANGKLELTDTNGTSNRIWNYNGVPFYYPYDTLTPFGFGDYWVKAQDGACALISNTFNVNSGHSFSVFDPNNGGYNGVNIPMIGSVGATFSINQTTNINSVTIIGLEDLHKRGTGYDLNLKIYDANEMEVFSKDVTLTPPFFGPLHIEVGYSLTANVDYTIAVSGDTAYSFKLYENVSYPATPHNNGITVKGAYEGAANQFPTQSSNYLLPFTINTDAQLVSVEEQDANSFEVYPNPATSGITIGGLKGGSEILLLDLNGKLIAKYNTSEKSVAIKTGNIPAGIYFVKITDSNTTTLQKVLFK